MKIPDNNALRIIVGFLIPGALILYAVLTLYDPQNQSGWRDGWAELGVMTTMIALGAMLLCGLVWGELWGLFEVYALGPIQRRRWHRKYCGPDPDHQQDKCTRYDDEWSYYSDHVDKYENTRLADIEIYLYLELGTGSALMVASFASLLMCDRVLPDHLLWASLAVGAGLFLLGCCRTNPALGRTRHRLLLSDPDSPYYNPQSRPDSVPISHTQDTPKGGESTPD